MQMRDNSVTTPTCKCRFNDTLATCCHEAHKSTPPKWQAPKRSTKAELAHQLRRLSPNRVHEIEIIDPDTGRAAEITRNEEY